MEISNEESRKPVLNTLLCHLKSVHKKSQRAKYLFKCIKNKVCPPTLLLKPPQNGASKNRDTQLQFINAANIASEKFLHIAHSDACKEAKEERQKYNRLYTEKLGRLSQPEQIRIRDLIHKQEPQIIKKWANKFRNKLHFLIQKTTGKQQEEDKNEVPGIHNPQQKPSRQRVWQQRKP